MRFKSHNPPLWYTHVQLDRAYCFPSSEEAQRVVEQLKRYGRRSTIVKLVEPPPPPDPPLPLIDPFTSFGPPDDLREWVDKIVEAGGQHASLDESIKAGYRALARKHHPDVGGSTRAMQALSDAHRWLVENESWAGNEFAFPSGFSDDALPF